MATIGVSDGSACWGVWLPPANPTDKSSPHLILSSIHPDSWLFVFRLQLRLAGRAGAWADAAQILESSDINILYGRCTRSGHHHDFWNVIGEALEIKGQQSPRFGRAEDLDGADEKKSYSREAIIRLLRFLPQLGREVEEASDGGPGFLYGKFAEPKIASFDAPEFSEEENLWKDHLSQAAKRFSYWLLPGLVDFWRRGLNVSSPLRFLYSAREQILKSNDPGTYADDLVEYELKTPSNVIGSFVPDQHYVRLIPLEEKEQARSVVVDLGYTMTFPRQPERSTSKGLARKLGETMADLDINLLHSRNMIQEFGPRKEVGRFQFLGRYEGRASFDEKKNEVEARVRGLDEVSKLNGNVLRIGESQVRQLGIGQIFLSAFTNASHRSAFEEAIAEKVAEHGFELFSIDAQSRNITEEVIRSVRKSVALIQVLTSKDADKPGEASETDLAWLTAEYSAALALDLPSLRILDLSVFDENDWLERLKIDKDKLYETYRPGKPDEMQSLQERIVPFLIRVRNRQMGL